MYGKTPPPPPPWYDYHALIICCLIALDKRPGVRSIGIGETLLRAIAKLVLREAGDQENTACGSLQLCVDIEAGIEGATRTVAQRRRDRTVSEPGGGSDEGS